MLRRISDEYLEGLHQAFQQKMHMLSTQEAKNAIKILFSTPIQWENLPSLSLYLESYLANLPDYFADQLCDWLIKDAKFAEFYHYRYKLEESIFMIRRHHAEIILRHAPEKMREELRDEVFTNKVEFVPLLLASEMVPDLVAHRKLKVFRALLNKPYLNYDAVQACLSMVQRGISPAETNRRGQTLLSILVLQYPKLQDHFPKQNWHDPVAFFKQIDMRALRIEIAFHTPEFCARSQLIVLLYLLANDRQNSQSTSGFKKIPTDILILILNFLPMENLKATQEQLATLTRFLMGEAAAVKSLARTPGGVNVCWLRSKNRFTFFKSATLLAREFAEQKIKVEQWAVDKKQRHKIPAALQKMDEIRNDRALTVFEIQAQTFKSTEQRGRFIELIEETDLYRPLVSKFYG